MDCGEDSTIIFEKPWIVHHQCQLNFATSQIIFSLNNHQFSTPIKNPIIEPQTLEKPTHNSMVSKGLGKQQPLSTTFQRAHQQHCIQDGYLQSMNPISISVFPTQSQVFSLLFPTKSRVFTSPFQGPRLHSKPTLPRCQPTS